MSGLNWGSPDGLRLCGALLCMRDLGQVSISTVKQLKRSKRRVWARKARRREPAGSSSSLQPPCVSGDTLEIHGTRIRLWGIDAPRAASFAAAKTASNTGAVLRQRMIWMRSLPVGR